MPIENIAELRAQYKPATGRALAKQLDALEPHSERFIALSPFLIIASAADNGVDASPRGGAPGFVRVVDQKTLWIPDAPGNNRLDSLSNIALGSPIGLLFLIPGVDETLRINGAARLLNEPSVLAQMPDGSRLPKVIIEVSIHDVYLHCAKALMRSALWSDTHRIDRASLPSMGQMIKDQTGSEGPVESQQAMIARYADDL